MDKFIIRYATSEEALPSSMRDSPLPKSSPKRPVGRPQKRPRIIDSDDASKNEQTTKKAALDDERDYLEPESAPPGFVRGHYKHYTLKQKHDIVKNAKLIGIRPTAEKFKIPKSTVNSWMKIDFSADLNLNGHLPKSGRPISYGQSIDDKIAQWVLTQRDLQIPVSIEGICIYAKELVSTEFPDSKFHASRSWGKSFMKRHGLVLRSRTSLAQRLPKDLEEKITSFHKFVMDRREEDEFDDKCIINMDETPMYFDLVPGKTVDREGTKSVLIRTTGAEKRHITVVLAVAGSGDVLPPMIIFKGKRTLDLKAPKGWLIAVQEKAWMDETLMLRWINEIYLPFTGRERSLLVMDSFRAHITDDVKKQLRRGNVVPAIIPGGCTSKLQPLDVSINKPVKSYLRRSWTEYIRDATNALQSSDETSNGRIKTASKQIVLDWVINAMDTLKEKRAMIVKSFKVCGISVNLSGSENALIRNDNELNTMDDDSDTEFEGFSPEDLKMAMDKLLETE